MSAYQLLKAFQAEVERMTGVRPYVDVNFHSHGEYSDEVGQHIRNYFTSFEGHLTSIDVKLAAPEYGTWTAYKAQSHDDKISICVHGPKTKETEQCGA